MIEAILILAALALVAGFVLWDFVTLILWLLLRPLLLIPAVREGYREGRALKVGPGYRPSASAPRTPPTHIPPQPMRPILGDPTPRPNVAPTPEPAPEPAPRRPDPLQPGARRLDL